MNSTSVLRQQSLNKILNDHSRMPSELIKINGIPNSSKDISLPHPNKRGVENQDPANSGNAQKATNKPSISRLPVLAKSLNLQTPNDFTQSHKIWEENTLAGKVRRKKQCTKTVPFNFSQPKANRIMKQNPRPPLVAASRAGPQPTQPAKSSATAHLNIRVVTNKPPSTALATQKHQSKSNIELSPHLNTGQHLAARKTGPSVSSQQNRGEIHGMEGPLRHQTPSAATSTQPPPKQYTDSAVHGPSLPGMSQVTSTFTPTLMGLPTAMLSRQSQNLNSASESTEPALTTESCLNHLNMLTLNDLSKTPCSVQSLQSAASVQMLSGTAGSGEAFCLDPRALRSILQNEGIATEEVPGLTTPQSTGFYPKAYKFLPQKVPVMKSRQKAQPQAARASCAPLGPSKMVSFSPDLAALSSILQNEGVEAGGKLGATPSSSVCPSGRGTSIYIAQRVPVRKNHTEATSGARVMALNKTPAMKWTPQRVPDTRHQSMSMRKLVSAHRTPYAASPRLRGHIRETHQEEVVQRLFKETDQEAEETEGKEGTRDLETGAAQPPQQTWNTEVLHSGPKGGQSWNSEDREAEKSNACRQPFFQAPHRESVIVFSTGKKQLRSAPTLEQKGAPGMLEQQGVSAAPIQELHPVRPHSSLESDTPSASQSGLNWQSNLSTHPQHRGVVQKGGSLSSGAALLRRHLPKLEMHLDDEVATYISVPPSFSSSSSSFCSVQKRCGNPVASILHLQDYTSFVPIINNLTSSGPTSPNSSPLRE